LSTIAPDRIAALLEPYHASPDCGLIERLSLYLDLLVKWNAKTNLSAIRDPEEMVRRHFGESLFAAGYLPREGTLLDLGSGAGFPGLPIALALPGLAVTLAESQNKKASFLREVVRQLDLPVEVWAGRAEAMPAERLFHIVTLRAVDSPEAAIQHARARLRTGGVLAHLTVRKEGSACAIPLPNSNAGVLLVESLCSTWNNEVSR
jgi:16S rRNA (guanine527-N7)-methyltransferase